MDTEWLIQSPILHPTLSTIPCNHHTNNDLTFYDIPAPPRLDEIEFLVPKDDPFALTTLSGNSALTEKARVQGWMRFRSPRQPNCEFFCDAITPPSLNCHMSNWVPSLEYSCHFFSSPDKEFTEEESKWVRITLCMVCHNNVRIKSQLTKHTH